MTQTTKRPEGPRVQRLWRYLVRHRWLFLFGAAALVLTNLLALEIPRALGAAVDALREHAPGAGDETAARVGGYALWMVILAVSAAAARVVSRVLIFDAGRRIEYELRAALYDHLVTLDGGFYQRIPSGDLTSRLANDVNQVRLLYGVGILNVVNTAVAYALALTQMVAIDPLLTLWCLLPYPLALLLVWRVVRVLYTRTRRVQEALSDLSSEVQEQVAGVAVVKAFGSEATSAERFAQSNARYLDESLSLAKARGLLMPLIGMLGGVGTLVLLGLGGWRVVEGAMTLGDFVAFNGFVVVLAWPTAALGWVLGVWQRGMAALDRLLEVLNERPAIASPPGARPQPLGGAIAFRDVSLEVEGRRVLDAVSFSVAPGELVAIVGRTGAGKSTLLEMIPRLREASAGQVLIDGDDVAARDLDSLRRQIGYVPQTPFLFSTTVRENVAFGLDAPADDPATIAQVEAMLEVAGLADDVARFPEGLGTLVGERGVTVSGGQKQRLTIARALAVDPPVLLLDDALSSVDARTERAIFNALTGPQARQRTVVLATHRLAGLERMDRVLVLHDGRLIEQGTHAALLAAGGHYAQLWRRQQLEASLEG